LTAKTANIDPPEHVVPRMRQVCDHLVNGATVHGYYRGLSTLMPTGFGSASGVLVAAFGDGTRMNRSSRMSPLSTTKLILWASLGLAHFWLVGRQVVWIRPHQCARFSVPKALSRSAQRRT
jgi:hypothetical protein